ncbi:PilZ domain-containing protein [Acinetobacter marinus]|uniref:PilZ domain-containing protein n=1 Tax=Acinetobacter marinus TaxID=281375 RepID=A0A1G6KWB3_9GAMM|nr:PilZ domain-containing protein [Acinetobacter marinus]SDC35370.1 PilZ domain-containing protein [Acinetobacter marinus]
MVQTQQTATHGERRQNSRADALLRFNYQEISKEQAQLDPYNPDFMIPRYFLLLSELAQIDSVLGWEIDAIKTEQPGLGHILGLLNQKLDLINTTAYDSLQNMLPSPKKVNISESGLSFFTKDALRNDSYIHLTFADTENHFQVAATAHVVYSIVGDDGMSRIGAHFISIHPKDREKLADSVEQLNEH